MHTLYIILLNIGILTSAPNTEQANISVLVKNLTTGEVIEQYREDKVVPPASVMKLVTTGCALEALGSDFRFTTTIEYSGKIEDGVLKGNLYVRGGCDPSLGDKKLKCGQVLGTWVKEIQKAGIRKIEGAVVADLSLLDGDATNPAWIWEDCGNYYAPGVFALNYLGNTLNIVLSSGEVGSKARVVGTEPRMDDLEIINNIHCTQITYDGAFVHGMPYSKERYLCGSIPSNLGTFGVRSDIPNPGLLLAKHLTRDLRAAGIAVSEEAQYETGGLHGLRTVLYEHKSPTLRKIVEETNMQSNNLYAESIFRYLGTLYGKPGTIHNSSTMVKDFWFRRGIHAGGSLIKDGCGLAPQDALSAETLVEILTHMSKSKEWDAWYESLPVSGKSGTLKSLCAKTPLEGRIHAKSGTIAGTKNYAGYIEMPNGDRWVFAILVNSAVGKARFVQTVIERYLVDLTNNN